MSKFILILLATFTFRAFAEPLHSADHVRHNMVVYGLNEIHASHIVYKKPHNYQVILSVRFPATSLAAYLAAKAEHPGDRIIFLLHPVDIGDIRSANVLSGSLFRRDSEGRRFDITPELTLDENSFDLVYFQELPLSLDTE